MFTYLFAYTNVVIATLFLFAIATTKKMIMFLAFVKKLKCKAKNLANFMM